MKTSMTDSKRTIPRKVSGSGYSSSYADKYKSKATKITNNNNSYQQQKVSSQLCNKSSQQQQINVINNKVDFTQTSSFNKPSIINLNNNNNNTLSSSPPNRKKSTKYIQSSSLSNNNNLLIKQQQWLGPTVIPAIKSNQSQIIRQPSQNDAQKTLSSIQPSSPHQLILKKHSNILIQQQLQQDLDIYNNYRLIQKQYLQEINQIKQQRQKIQKQCKNQRKRISQIQQLLLLKKKKLHELEEKFNDIKNHSQRQKIQQTKLIRNFQERIKQLTKQHKQITNNKQYQLNSLQQQLTTIKKQHNKLQQQLQNLQQQLESYQLQQQQYNNSNGRDNQDEKKTIQQLVRRQEELRQEIGRLVGEEMGLNQQLQQMDRRNKQLIAMDNQQQSQHIDEQQQQQYTTLTTPTTLHLHKRYLSTYENIFLLNQLQRAQQLLRLKQQQKLQLEQIQKRKFMINQRKIQLTLKQKRIIDKNKIIDQLTQQIRQKSTILLNLYQQQQV